jgi:hypothetical protein
MRNRNVKEPLYLRKGRKVANSIGGQSRRQQLRLGSMGIANEIFGKSIGLEFVKRANGMSNRLRKVKDWVLWRGRPPPKRLKSY